MRYRITLPALLLLLTAPFTHLAHAQETAPGFTLEGINAQVDLTEYNGKVVYPDFWAFPTASPTNTPPLKPAR
jgi:hypothetical protein